MRRFPRSRRHPHFAIDALPHALARAGIGYAHLPGLGGFRRPSASSVNRAWRNPGFSAYADYMQTDEFTGHLETLLRHAAEARVSIMCAEAMPTRCHRQLIGDALVARGLTVIHVLAPDRAEPHVLRPWARVEGPRVTYPGEPELFG